MKKSADLVTAQQLHQSGLLDAAKEAYLEILEEQPEASEALHGLGILSAQQGDFNAATDYLRNAIQHQPQNHTLYLNLSNSLKTLGKFDEAIEVLQQAIAINPEYSAALNNLGTIYYAQNKLEDATHHYRLATQKRTDYIDAYYNLGLALTKQQQYEAAMSQYEKILKLAPEHSAAHFQLACLLLQQDKIIEAEKHFLLIEQQHPHHLETQSNLATCYLKQGAFSQAKKHYLKALALAPEDTQILFNLGVINMMLGHIDTAIENYLRAVRINPDYFDAHNNLGVAFLTKQHIPYALQHFKEALRIQPQNKAIDYTVKMLAQDQRLHASPPEYIKNLFDTYADHYDAHLLHTLEYKIPQHLLKAVTEVLKQPSKMDILDLGCGTGLCALVFKPLAKTLTGVDLSEKMLAIAASKNIYDDIVSSDLLNYLSTQTSAFDLMLAGDVFVYSGDLDAIFKAANIALRDGGLLAFNTEISDSKDYAMNPSGRFAHQKKYLDRLAQQHGFRIARYESIISRQQQHTDVHGHLYVLQKVS